MRSKIVILFAFLLLVSGCINRGGGNDEIERNIYVGTQGVNLDIFDMPDEANENEELSFVVKVDNKGPYETNGIILVSTEEDYIGMSSGRHVITEQFSLSGKTVFNDIDDFEILNFPLYIKSLSPLSEIHESYILTQLCYEYRGLAYTDLCIDTDPYDSGDSEKACSAQSSISLGQGQGGPVVIDSVVPKMLLDGNVVRPQLKIHIRNTGSGSVFQKGYMNQVCSSDPLQITTYNTITLKEVELSGRSLSGGQIECIPQNLQLRDEEDFVTCTVVQGQGISREMLSFETPLKIEIEYGYTESISKQISIKKILQY